MLRATEPGSSWVSTQRDWWKQLIASDARIHDLDDSIGRTPNVVRAEVSVHNTLGVHGAKPSRDLDAEIPSPVPSPGSGQGVGKILTVKKLLKPCRAVLLVAPEHLELRHGLHDVRGIESPQQIHLPRCTLKCLRTAPANRYHLQYVRIPAPFNKSHGLLPAVLELFALVDAQQVTRLVDHRLIDRHARTIQPTGRICCGVVDPQYGYIRSPSEPDPEVFVAGGRVRSISGLDLGE